jgi:valyl-tRNA synthetase
MPFLSEELFEKMNINKKIISENLNWPKSDEVDSVFLNNFDDLINVISKLRNFKKQKNIGFKDELSIFHENTNFDESFSSVFKKLTNCKLIFSNEIDPEISSTIVVGKFRYNIDYVQETSDDDVNELKKILEYNLGFKTILEKKLSNTKFVENAPEKVIQNERNKLDDVLKKIEIIKETISKKN